MSVLLKMMSLGSFRTKTGPSMMLTIRISATTTNIVCFWPSSRASKLPLISSKHDTHRIIVKNNSHFFNYVNDNHKQQYTKISFDVSSSRSATTEAVISHPRSSLWADKVFSEDEDLARDECVREIEILEEEVRNRLASCTEHENPKDKLTLIDTLERMGVAHHFEEEIDYQLKRIVDFGVNDWYKDEDCSDLFTTALHFRLLRQHGYDVPCSVFNKFKGEDNAFKRTLCGDIEGLLSLYEASFVRYHEEGILQEARDYARHQLSEAMPHLEESYLKERLTRALKQPLHWALPKVEARHYIKIYEALHESKDETILRFAKLDLHLSQKLYAKELSDVQKWLNSYENLFQELWYARNNVVECYFWAAGICFEPQHSLPRITIAKTIVLCTILNDTYDSYASMEELQLFTEVILSSWDTKEINKLPKSMKTLYKTLSHALQQFESEVSGHQQGTYAANVLKETMKELARLYLKKAKWYNKAARDHIPTFQEHMETGAYVSALRQTIAAYYMHLESSSSSYSYKESDLDWLMSMPTIVKEAALYCRYLNDVTSYEREHETGQYPTAIDCYMQESGSSKRETMDKFAEFAEVSWTTINREWIKMTTDNKRDAVKPVINFARLMYAIYGEGFDGFTSLRGKLYALVDALLEPVTL